MMITPQPSQPPDGEQRRSFELQHVELQLSARDITFLLTGFATLLAFIGGGFIVFNNEVCKPFMNISLQEIKQIQLEIKEIKEKIKEKTN